MQTAKEQWKYEVERGPDWLFVKLVPPADEETPSPHFGREIWNLLQHHTAHRVVIEMDQVQALPKALLGELVTLQEQIAGQQGVLRLSGLNRPCQAQVTKQRLDEQLPAYPTRAEAIFGARSTSAK